MNIGILLRLLFAHIFADFFLQTTKMCEEKESNGKQKYGYLLLHSLIHSIAAYLLVAQWCNWIIPLSIFLTHVVMDYIKSSYMKDNAASFIMDQVIHVIVIVSLWLCMFVEHFYWSTELVRIWNNHKIWIIVISYLLVLKPTSILLNLFIKQWMPHDSKEEHTLPHAGLWIGYLERILILTFIYTHNFEGIGFLLAAKSIFRFGELNKAQEIKITEYVLIGTLASFTIAIIIGIVALQLL